MPTPPISVAVFKEQFARDFRYGTGLDTVRDSDIIRALAVASTVYNRSLFDATTGQIAFGYLSAHYLALNIQAAGGLSVENYGKGVNSRGSGTIQSKGVGAVNVGFVLPDWITQSPILSQYMTTNYGQQYLSILTPFLVGNMMIAPGPGTVQAVPGANGLAATPALYLSATLLLPDAEVSIPYTFNLTASGGAGNYTWEIAPGNLPPGLALNGSIGQISGTPTTAGTYTFTARVFDQVGDTAISTLSLTVAP